MSKGPGLPRAPKPKLSELGRLDDVCPYCDEPLPKRPKRKTICPHCGNAIYVRVRPLDRARVLLTEAQTRQVENEWTTYQAWAKRHGR